MIYEFRLIFPVDKVNLTFYFILLSDHFKIRFLSLFQMAKSFRLSKYYTLVASVDFFDVLAIVIEGILLFFYQRDKNKNFIGSILMFKIPSFKQPIKNTAQRINLIDVV